VRLAAEKLADVALVKDHVVAVSVAPVKLAEETLAPLK